MQEQTGFIIIKEDDLLSEENFLRASERISAATGNHLTVVRFELLCKLLMLQLKKKYFVLDLDEPAAQAAMKVYMLEKNSGSSKTG